MICTRDLPETSVKQVRQVRTNIQSALLRELKHVHHLRRVFVKEIALIGVELSIANEKRPNPRLVAAHQRQKTEKGTCSFRGPSARKLFCDPLRHAKNVSCVLIVLPHERLASELPPLRRIVQAFCDLLLHIKMQKVCGPPRRVVQIRTNAKKEIASPLDPALIGFAQPIFSDKVSRRQGAFLEISHPEQILIIA